MNKKAQIATFPQAIGSLFNRKKKKKGKDTKNNRNLFVGDNVFTTPPTQQEVATAQTNIANTEAGAAHQLSQGSVPRNIVVKGEPRTKGQRFDVTQGDLFQPDLTPEEFTALGTNVRGGRITPAVQRLLLDPNRAVAGTAGELLQQRAGERLEGIRLSTRIFPALRELGFETDEEEFRKLFNVPGFGESAIEGLKRVAPGATAGLTAGAVGGSVVPGVGTAIGAAGGALAGGTASFINSFRATSKEARAGIIQRAEPSLESLKLDEAAMFNDFNAGLINETQLVERTNRIMTQSRILEEELKKLSDESNDAFMGNAGDKLVKVQEYIRENSFDEDARDMGVLLQKARDAAINGANVGELDLKTNEEIDAILAAEGLNRLATLGE